MSSEIAIRVESLSKCYQIYEQPRDRLKQFILPRLRRSVGLPASNYYREFWALRDVSFEVKKGETVGIIGRNGSGKSTLLQMICGTLNPTDGNIQTKGRIAALLELGSGFNPEFSGRENVYLSCAVLGMSKAETDARFDGIVAFADIGSFIDQPVKTYSSGMFVRLAFSVNIMSEPQIMIVDEALSVGDMNFQAKCMTALTRIQERGATVIFVSHDVGAVKSLCKKAVYLEHGRVVASGAAPEIAERYVRAMREEMSADVRRFSRASSEFGSADQEAGAAKADDSAKVFKCSSEFDRRVALHRYGSGGVRTAYVELVDNEHLPLQSVAFNQEVKIVIFFEAESVKPVTVAFNILDDKKINLVGGGFAQVGQEPLMTCIGGRYRAEYDLRLPLKAGDYSLRIQIASPVAHGQSVEFLDVVEEAVVFHVDRWNQADIWSKVHLYPNLQLSVMP